jgi:catechol 2,3-dioxygenase
MKSCKSIAQIIFYDDSEKASQVTVTNKIYEIAIAEDKAGQKGRLHHTTYAVDNREEVPRAADICLEKKIFSEIDPHK